jgi:hypothetical protein
MVWDDAFLYGRQHNLHNGYNKDVVAIFGLYANDVMGIINLATTLSPSSVPAVLV